MATRAMATRAMATRAIINPEEDLCNHLPECTTPVSPLLSKELQERQEQRLRQSQDQLSRMTRVQHPIVLTQFPALHVHLSVVVHRVPELQHSTTQTGM